MKNINRYGMLAFAVLTTGLLLVLTTKGSGNTFSRLASLVRSTFTARPEPVAEIPLRRTEESVALSIRNEINETIPEILPWCNFETIEKNMRRTPLAFSEIAWMGTTDDFKHEWIELMNVSETAVDVSGWQIQDKNGDIMFLFPEHSFMPANGFFVLAREGSAIPGAAINAFFKGNLKNSDEALKLFDRECRLIDSVSADPLWPAGDNKTKQTMERNYTDLSWYTSAKPNGTPGKENSGLEITNNNSRESGANSAVTSSQSEPSDIQSQPGAQSPEDEQFQYREDELPMKVHLPDNGNEQSQEVPEKQTEPKSIEPIQSAESNKSDSSTESDMPDPSTEPAKPPNPVVVSEIMAGMDGNANYDFIELYNNSESAVNLAGWSIKKQNSKGSISSLAVADRFDGKIIPPRSFFLLARTDGYNGNVVPDIWWPKSYDLAYKNYAIMLYNADGEEVDRVQWEEIPKGSSYERISFEDDVFYIQNSPNPQNSSL